MELRDRPWVTLGEEQIHFLGGKGGAHKSFPSNHAANITGLAIIFSAVYPKRNKWFYSLAGLIAFSRIYIGVHYPLDVLAGVIMGAIYAWLLLTIWRKWRPQDLLQ